MYVHGGPFIIKNKHFIVSDPVRPNVPKYVLIKEYHKIGKGVRKETMRHPTVMYMYLPIPIYICVWKKDILRCDNFFTIIIVIFFFFYGPPKVPWN
jgi:hypothetical protein